MKHSPYFISIALLVTVFLVTLQFSSCKLKPSDSSAQTVKKELYIPAKVWGVPENNDFKNDTSKY